MFMFLNHLRLVRFRAARARKPVVLSALALTALDQMYAYYERD